MDGMAMVTTLKSNAARNTAASITASAYQRRAFMTCRSCTRRAMQDGLLWCALFDSPADHCRFPRSSARPPSSLVGRMPRAERDAAGMPRAKGRRHENHDHGEPARNRVLALPACPGGVVVPGLECAATAGADAVWGAAVKALHFRAAVGTAGVIALLAAHLGAAGAEGAAPMTARALVVSDQARRYLTLAYRSPTEFMGCMIGEVRGPAVYVERIAPADVDPTYSTQTHVLPRQTCEEAGWVGTVGMIHSHPGGERCFYYFPGTEVASSDAASFARQPYPVDAIMCGDSLVWISRNRAQRQLRLADGPARMTLDHQLGNRVHTGTLAARGG